MQETVKFIKKCKTFFISTVNENTPVTRPFGAITYYKGNVYVTTGKNRNTYKHILKNPNVQIVALLSGTRDWVRITGVCKEETNEKIKALTFKDNPILEKRYDTYKDDNFALLRVEVGSIEKRFEK